MQTSPTSPSARILIVEDEPLIAMMITDLCEEIGHEVAGTAGSVAGALALVERGGIDAAILDVHLQGNEACWPVADALAERGTPFVIASGGEIEPPPDRHATRPVLAKPFSFKDASRALSELLQNI